MVERDVYDAGDYDQREPAKTYRIVENGKAIQCLRCQMISHNLNDVSQKYCGHCHLFHSR